MALIEFQTNAGTVSPFPLVRCRNVYSLPGIPSLLQEKWPKALEDILRRNQTTTEYHTVVLRLSTDDETVVSQLLIHKIIVLKGAWLENGILV